MTLIKNAIIYLLFSEKADLYYYGSTRQKLCQRLAEHKRDAKVNKSINSKKIMKCDDYKIIALEIFENIESNDLKIKESYYITNNKCINKNVPGATLKENYMRDYMRNYMRTLRSKQLFKVATNEERSAPSFDTQWKDV